MFFRWTIVIRGFSVFEFLTPFPGHRRLSMSIRNGKVGWALCEKNYAIIHIYINLSSSRFGVEIMASLSIHCQCYRGYFHNTT